MDNLSFFLDALQSYGYLQNAMIAGVLVGTICGVIGCFIILKRMALMGDAISHAVLPGVVIAYIYGFSFFIGAVITGVITSLGIGYIGQGSRIKDDSAMGIMFTAAFAVGIVMITALDGSEVDLWHILFGNVLAVSTGELWLIVGVGIFVLASIFILYREFVISTFDPVMAKAIGIPTNLLHYLFMLLLSFVIVASLQTVGIVLVVAMLITPASTAYLLTDRLFNMLVLSSVFGVISSLIGVYFSFIYDVATGGAIVVVASVIFFITLLVAPKHGVLIRSIKRTA
ncbi:metal ABC transporter permease [Natranaerofaba carboxydovora]|uniref:metal ABC transporter permease n=1 Tax=Natranaerofaba carboxydovora TaxID=2742683 RepID=UPI001F13FB89|nr:metal ABC transporter permease [Natranaerofaba carboxydovora]UMZ74216.1 Manganese transport system membrane protein MntB [Natranaerofaba carboxydovora]